MKRFELPVLTSQNAGYSELRRSLIVGAPAAMALLLASPRRLLAALDDLPAGDDLERFLETTAGEALALKSDDSAPGQERYVRYIERAVAAINDVPTDSIGANSWKGFDPGVFLGVGGRNRACFVVHWRLAPQAFLPPHCHPKTSVCTLGLDGEATLRHYEAEASAPSYRDDRETEFLITETVRLDLARGTTSTLTEHRDNIHLFQAGRSGARGIDVTTDYGGDGSFSFLAFDHERPEDAARKTYVARWIGTDI